MNENKAPKLDPQKILQAISALDNNSSNKLDIGFVSFESTHSGDRYGKSQLFSFFLKVKNRLRKKGVYKYFHPINYVLKKMVRIASSLQRFTQNTMLKGLRLKYMLRNLIKKILSSSHLLTWVWLSITADMGCNI